MKKLPFLGNALSCLRDFPEAARQDAGYQLSKVQAGGSADDCKPIPSIGLGVEEIRVWSDAGTFRVVYTARFVDAVYVLHAFQKKTQTTEARHIALAKARYASLKQERS